jgi:hypothetical protein|tara:strand:+ start:114 stop:452 length:339 start_codon:yes stop_codon:yes gene_type:complete
MANGSRSESLDEKEQHWRKQLRLWRQSGLNQAAFCREHNLNRWRFSYWKKKLPAGSEGEISFVKLPAMSVSTTAPDSISVMLGENYRVEITSNFEAGTLGRLLDVLEHRRQP